MDWDLLCVAGLREGDFVGWDGTPWTCGSRWGPRRRYEFIGSLMHAYPSLAPALQATAAHCNASHASLCTLVPPPSRQVGWICLAGPMCGWTKDKKSGATVRPWILCVLRCDLSEAEGACPYLLKGSSS